MSENGSIRQRLVTYLFDRSSKLSERGLDQVALAYRRAALSIQKGETKDGTSISDALFGSRVNKIKNVGQKLSIEIAKWLQENYAPAVLVSPSAAIATDLEELNKPPSRKRRRAETSNRNGGMQERIPDSGVPVQADSPAGLAGLLAASHRRSLSSPTSRFGTGLTSPIARFEVKQAAQQTIQAVRPHADWSPRAGGLLDTGRAPARTKPATPPAGNSSSVQLPSRLMDKFHEEEEMIDREERRLQSERDKKARMGYEGTAEMLAQVDAVKIRHMRQVLEEKIAKARAAASRISSSSSNRAVQPAKARPAHGQAAAAGGAATTGGTVRPRRKGSSTVTISQRSHVPGSSAQHGRAGSPRSLIAMGAASSANGAAQSSFQGKARRAGDSVATHGMGTHAAVTPVQPSMGQSRTGAAAGAGAGQGSGTGGKRGGRKRKRPATFQELYKPIMDSALDAADAVRAQLGIGKHVGAGNRRKGRIKYGSAGYAIMLVLYRARMGWGSNGFYSVPEESLLKPRIVKLSGQFYLRPERLDETDRAASGAQAWYTGWSTMSTLVTEHGYVESYQQSRQKHFRLTPIGVAVAEVLSKEHPLVQRLHSMHEAGAELPRSIDEARTEVAGRWTSDARDAIGTGYSASAGTTAVPSQGVGVGAAAAEQAKVNAQPPASSSSSSTYAVAAPAPVLAGIPTMSSDNSSSSSSDDDSGSDSDLEIVAAHPPPGLVRSSDLAGPSALNQLKASSGNGIQSKTAAGGLQNSVDLEGSESDDSDDQSGDEDSSDDWAIPGIGQASLSGGGTVPAMQSAGQPAAGLAGAKGVGLAAQQAAVSQNDSHGGIGAGRAEGLGQLARRAAAGGHGAAIGPQGVNDTVESFRSQPTGSPPVAEHRMQKRLKSAAHGDDDDHEDEDKKEAVVRVIDLSSDSEGDNEANTGHQGAIAARHGSKAGAMTLLQLAALKRTEAASRGPMVSNAWAISSTTTGMHARIAQLKLDADQSLPGPVSLAGSSNHAWQHIWFAAPLGPCPVQHAQTGGASQAVETSSSSSSSSSSSVKMPSTSTDSKPEVHFRPGECVDPQLWAEDTCVGVKAGAAAVESHCSSHASAGSASAAAVQGALDTRPRVVVLVAHNEPKRTFDALLRAGVPIESATIPPGGGDLLWAVRVGQQLYMTGHAAERKTAEDLTGSIMSGSGKSRYLEQKYYLWRSGLRRLMYILEGDTDKRQIVGGSVNTALMALSADASTVSEGFAVWRTEDLAHTGRVVARLTEAIQAVAIGREGHLRKEQEWRRYDRTFEAWCTGLKAIRQNQHSLGMVSRRMLGQIGGLMSRQIDTILHSYGTYGALVHALRRRFNHPREDSTGGQVGTDHAISGRAAGGLSAFISRAERMTAAGQLLMVLVVPPGGQKLTDLSANKVVTAVLGVHESNEGSD